MFQCSIHKNEILQKVSPILFISHTAIEDTIYIMHTMLKSFEPHLQRLQVIQPNTTTVPLGSTGSTDSTGSTGGWIIVLYSNREKKTNNEKMD